MVSISQADGNLDEAIESFYRTEARALQTGDLAAWLCLLSEDIRYRVYHSISMERDANGGGSGPQSLYYDDNIESLRLRVRKLSSSAAWSESPKPRRRYFWQTLSVDVVQETSVRVSGNIHVSFIRGDRQRNDYMGGRDDILVMGVDCLKLERRDVELDLALVTDRFLNTFF